jgi:hypothetical protein
MDQEKKDNERQRLQFHMNQLVSKYLHNNYPAIEHRPGERVLLQLPPGSTMEKTENAV